MTAAKENNTICHFDASAFVFLLNCDKSELSRERKGYADALLRYSRYVYNSGEMITNELRSNEQPILLHLDPPKTSVPNDLTKCSFPTITFQIDTFSKPKWRALWSTLFDYVIVFHPGYERVFSRYGHRRIIFLPHAIAAEEYLGGANDDQEEKLYEIGWIGRIDGSHYKARRRILPIISARHTMNDWQRYYNESEIQQIYRTSKIVVNIGRDDYPQDANLRCFEAMAAGALLITRLPSELELIGFKSGEHFLGFRTDEELLSLIGSFLLDDQKRREIAIKAKDIVLREHTYDARVATLLSILSKDAGQKFAPARQWSQEWVNYVYLHYFCKRGNYQEAIKKFKKLVSGAPSLALYALPHILRCWQHKLKVKDA